MSASLTSGGWKNGQARPAETAHHPRLAVGEKLIARDAYAWQQEIERAFQRAANPRPQASRV
jgi:hypothetical protein